MALKMIVFMFIVLMVTGTMIAVSYHENSHVVVFQNSGFKNILIEYNLLDAATSAEVTEYSNFEMERKYNMIVDIFGYHVIGFIMNLWLIAFFLVASFMVIKQRYG